MRRSGELSLVVLDRDLPSHGLEAGDVGTVVFVYADGEAYEIEFASLEGRTLTVTTVEAGDVRRVEDDDIAHVRKIGA